MYRTDEQADDMAVGTVIFNVDHDILAVKHDEDSWTVYFPERHESMHNEDIDADDPGDQIVGQVHLKRSIG